MNIDSDEIETRTTTALLHLHRRLLAQPQTSCGYHSPLTNVLYFPHLISCLLFEERRLHRRKIDHNTFPFRLEPPYSCVDLEIWKRAGLDSIVNKKQASSVNIHRTGQLFVAEASNPILRPLLI